MDFGWQGLAGLGLRTFGPTAYVDSFSFSPLHTNTFHSASSPHLLPYIQTLCRILLHLRRSLQSNTRPTFASPISNTVATTHIQSLVAASHNSWPQDEPQLISRTHEAPAVATTPTPQLPKMAANEYYSSSFPSRREDAPLPPVPSSSPGPRPANSTPGVNVSPATSPFDDHAYPEYPAASKPTQQNFGDTGYYGASGRTQNPHNSDPFIDQNAIPLQPQSYNPKMEGSPTRYNADPEGRYPLNGGGTMGQRRKKKGWFSGKVTWVCYILTTVQVAVFIGELIKNGIVPSPSHYIYQSGAAH